MHRELSPTDTAFARPSTAGLYAFTAAIGLLILRDLWPTIADWLNSFGAELPVGSNRIYGQRYAVIAAVLGGARILAGALGSLMDGRIGADLAVVSKPTRLPAPSGGFKSWSRCSRGSAGCSATARKSR
jgi:hypothetical protein